MRFPHDVTRLTCALRGAGSTPRRKVCVLCAKALALNQSPKTFPAFLRRHTRVGFAPACPEIALHLGTTLTSLWSASERWRGALGLPPPYWGFAWPGGQAMARYVLDHREVFCGSRVLDLGAGSGIASIAAAQAGAREVDACDTDPLCASAIDANAALNGVTIRTLTEDLIGGSSRWHVVVAADLWYEPFLARRVTNWLRMIAAQGTHVLLGDQRRRFFPRQGLIELARYAIPTPQDVERHAVTDTGVWKLQI